MTNQITFRPLGNCCGYPGREFSFKLSDDVYKHQLAQINSHFQGIPRPGPIGIIKALIGRMPILNVGTGLKQDTLKLEFRSSWDRSKVVRSRATVRQLAVIIAEQLEWRTFTLNDEFNDAEFTCKRSANGKWRHERLERVRPPQLRQALLH